jgi:hypothetical protein
MVNAVGRVAPGLARRAKAVVSKTADEVNAWLNAGPSNTVVYLAFRAGSPLPVYVGITQRDPETRRVEHNREGKNFAFLAPITPKIAHRLARSIETTLILANPQFENKRLSVGWGNKFFDDAVHAGTSWLLRDGSPIYWGK